MEQHQRARRELLPYSPPDFARGLKYLPKYRVQLAHPNTPIHEWNLPGVPGGFSVHIKRDDMTGSTLSGNKIRALEFLLADAIDKGCSHVITRGHTQSNQCRATVLACAQLGLTTHSIIRDDAQTISDVKCTGNLLLNRLGGGRIYIAPKAAPDETEILARAESLAESIKRRSGESCYIIPMGGAHETGMFGYLSAFEELMSQGVQENFDDIVVACGSGTTAVGLAIGNILTGSKLRIHCIRINDEKDFHTYTQGVLFAVGLGSIKSEDIVDIIYGHMGLGRNQSTTEEEDFIRDVCVKTGVVLDPVYTVKAALGLVKELQKNPDRFQGKRVLFVHTGGMFEFFDGRMDSVLKQANSTSNRIKLWPNKDMDPPY